MATNIIGEENKCLFIRVRRLSRGVESFLKQEHRAVRRHKDFAPKPRWDVGWQEGWERSITLL